MNSWSQRTARTLMLAAGFAAAGTGLSTAAFASTGPTTSGAGSVAGGNQVRVPITIPVNVCGNAAAILGVATAGCEGGAAVTDGGGAGPALHTSGKGSVLGGNQLGVPVKAPLDVCGNAAGNDSASCLGGAKVDSARGKGSMTTDGTGSVLGGNQVTAPVKIPVDVCGNSVAVLGVADSICKGGAAVVNGRMPKEQDASSVTSLLPAVGQGWSSTPVELAAYQTGRPSALPEKALSAADEGTMSSVSFFTLTGGILLAGASALLLPGRRARAIRGARKGAA